MKKIIVMLFALTFISCQLETRYRTEVVIDKQRFHNTIRRDTYVVVYKDIYSGKKRALECSETFYATRQIGDTIRYSYSIPTFKKGE